MWPALLWKVSAETFGRFVKPSTLSRKLFKEGVEEMIADYGWVEKFRNKNETAPLKVISVTENTTNTMEDKGRDPDVEKDSPLDEDDEFEFSFNYNDIESAKRKPGQLMCFAKRVKRDASVCKEPVEALYCGMKREVRVFDERRPGRHSTSHMAKGKSGQSGIISCPAVSEVLPVYAAGCYDRKVGLHSEQRDRLCVNVDNILIYGYFKTTLGLAQSHLHPA